jgi:hypothetical protein
LKFRATKKPRATLQNFCIRVGFLVGVFTRTSK